MWIKSYLAIFFLLFTLLTISHQESIAQYRGFRFENDRAKRIEIPFELHSNLIIIPVIINDGPPLKFILDTGVRTAILTSEVYVEGLPKPNDREINLLGVGSQGEITAYVTNDVSFSIEGVEAEGNAMLVLKEDYLQLDSYLGARVHGILGYELFSRFVVEIDYANLLLTIHNPDTFKPRRKYTEISIEIEDTKPYIEACLTMNDSTQLPVKLMIDTGASQPLMLSTQSAEKIRVPKKNVAGYLGRGLSGEIYGAMGRITRLEFDKFSLVEVISSFPEDSSMYAMFTERKQNGNIGGEILKRFKVIFDYANEKLYLDKNRAYKKPFSYNMSGISLMAIGPSLNIFIISNIIEPSPASNVGLKEGDIVLNVNGIRSKDLTLSTFSELVHKRPGKRIRITVYRDGEFLKMKFRLERIL